MNKQRVLSALLCCGVMYGVAQDEFVIKKEKKASTTTLKEQCCEWVTDTLTLTPHALTGIAATQTDLMDVCSLMLNGSFFDKASKDDVASCTQQARKVFDLQEKINALIKEQQQNVHVLKMMHTK